MTDVSIRPAAADDIQATLGGDFFTALRHKRGLKRTGVAGDRQYIVCTGQLKINRHGDRLHQHAEIALLNVPTIFAQMHRDGIGPAQLGKRRRPNRIGLVRLASLTDRRHVVDVDA